MKQIDENSENAMEKLPRNNDEKRVGITPSIALLNRLLGPSPAPRMLTLYEIKLLRQSKKEVAEVARAILTDKNDTQKH